LSPLLQPLMLLGYVHSFDFIRWLPPRSLLFPYTTLFRSELHLRHLRKALHTQSLRYAQAVSEYFPEDMRMTRPQGGFVFWIELRSEEHTSELQSRENLVCRLLLEKKKKYVNITASTDVPQ